MTALATHLRQVSTALETASAAFPELDAPIRALCRLQGRLQRPLRIAIVGEFNSGKSSLANRLVGIDSLPTAVLSNTRIPTLLYHAAVPEIFAVRDDSVRAVVPADLPVGGQPFLRLEVGLPSGVLEPVQILDLPGLADPRFDQSSINLAMHQIDAVLWCTVATQAWKESERAAWELLAPRLRQRGLLVVTHRDLVTDPEDEAKLMQRLREQAGPDFRDIVIVSTIADAGGTPADGMDTMSMALELLLEQVRDERVTSALRVARRVGEQTASRLERGPERVL